MAVVRRRGLETLKLLFKSKAFLAGFSIIVLVSAVAILADHLATYPPLEFVGRPFTPPSRRFYFGTDDMGRDIYSMTIYGTRVSLTVGIIAAALTTALGTAVGITCGMLRGIVDAFTMRVIDFLLSLPYLAVALAIVAFLKPSLWIMILIIVILSWVSTAKIVRAQTIVTLEYMFIEAAKAIGASRLYIALKHVIPNVIPVVLTSLTLNVRGAILFEASLSFLGFGDPENISWGTILFFARRSGAFTAGAWWNIVPPGLMIMITVLGFTLVSVGLDEVLNPRLRKV